MTQGSLTTFESGAHGDGRSPSLDSPEHLQVIDGARVRSLAYGLRASDAPDYSVVQRGAMQDALQENGLLCRHAMPVMETLYQQIVNTQSMVLLTARSGMVLHSLGDADFLAQASRVALQPGVDWSERSKGTNAIGTALTEGLPLVVHGDQHFLEANRFLTCSCTPIFDPLGDVVGALDVTSHRANYHQHTMALVRMSAQMIENHMFADVFPRQLLVRFHARAEFLGTLVEGIAVFTPDGRFVSANRSAQFQLGLSVNALSAHTFSSLFGRSVSQLHDGIRKASGQPISLCLHNGVTVHCTVQLNTPARVATLVENVHAEPAPPPAHGRRDSGIDLQSLNTGDPQIASVIHKLSLIRGRDIPIMILGETGTGKDWLAQAIHHDSPRAHGPFVSVNCASIPENLIESELFGYEEGAFTGARRKGAMGKIQCADGGTLFLDEIGDMPRPLQARLLRVLQERTVNPLGSGKEIPVNVAIICATHKNLRDMMARGEFREDLYYRLNGLVVRLPALREREDLAVVIQKMLTQICAPSAPLVLAPEVVARFRQSRWPGNFRQLHNLLQTAVVMAGDGRTLELDHLPDDFLEEADSALKGPAADQGKQAVSHSPITNTTTTPNPTRANEVPARTGLEGIKLEQLTRDLMAQALAACDGNVSAAARQLGISRNTFYRKKAQLLASGEAKPH